MRVGAICGPRLPAGHGPPGGCLYRWSLTLDAPVGEERTPPGEDEGGPFPGRPAGAAASKAERKASVLLAVRRLPTAKPWSAPTDPFGPHLSQKAPPRCGQRQQRRRVVTYLMRQDR